MNDIERLISNYKPTPNTIDLVKKTKIALLAGISGAGKDTIKKKLLLSRDFQDVVSHTTRSPRANNGKMEQDGIDYHFIDMAQAEVMLTSHEFIEAKFVHGTVYGTAAKELRKIYDNDKIAITDLDVQGVAEYESLCSSSISIFIVPPDYDTWVQRLSSRYQSRDAFLSEWPKRRASAIDELTHALEVPYYHVIINDDLERAVRVTKEIIKRGDLFNKRDDEARLTARQLLQYIKETR